MKVKEYPRLRIALIIAVVLTMLWPAHAIARKQGQERLDSLLQCLPKLKEDTVKAGVLCRLSFLYCGINPDEGIKYALQSIALAEKLEWSRGIAEAYNDLAINYVYKSDNTKAIDCWTIALKAYEKANYKPGVLKIVGNIGNVFMIQGDYSSALENDMKALKLAEELGDKSSIELNLGNIGSSYEYLGNYDKALQYHLSALKVAKELDEKVRIANDLGNIGNVFLDLKKDDSALAYHVASMKYYEELGNNEGIGRSLINIGDVYLKKKKYVLALENAFKSLKIFEKMSYNYGIARSDRTIGQVYLQIVKDSGFNASTGMELTNSKELAAQNQGSTGFYNRTSLLMLASQYLNKAIAINKELQILDDLRLSYMMLSETQSLLGNHAVALENYKLYTQINDSIFSTANKVKITNLETKRELALKDKQIELDKLAVLKKKNERVFFIAGIVLLLIIIIIVFRYYRGQRVLNALLYEEKLKVEASSTELKLTNEELEDTLVNLKKTQDQLILTEKQKENEIIRSRISQDIHDDVSSELTKISWVSELAKAKMKKDDIADVAKLLDKITASSRETVMKLGEIIWTINPNNDNLDSLMSYMRNHIAKFLADTPFQYRIQFPEQISAITINPELKRNLYLVLKEALNNAVKYSKASTIEVSFSTENNNYTLAIADNGVGMDGHTILGTGNGMGNMRKRMDAVGGTIDISSAPGKGTAIRLSGTLY